MNIDASPAHARAGFSFIEIVVSLMIIAIMAVGAFAAFKWIEKAKITRTATSLQNIRLAITSFQSDTGSLPATLAELATRPSAATVAKRWRGPYAESAELLDAWGSEFVYMPNPKNTQHPYELYSWGKNKEGSPQDEWITGETS